MTGAGTRRAGLMAPLFSVPSSRSWGIGEIGDLPAIAAWLTGAGQRVLQLLPINELPLHETSPYSAMSAMAIDPQFITLGLVDEFVEAGGEAALEPGLRSEIARLRETPVLDYHGVRALKHSVLRRSYQRFANASSTQTSPRAQAFGRYVVAQSWWLDDYALFRALHAHYGERPWTEWPEPLKSREADAVAAARVALADEVAFRQYVQWVADDQWRAARRGAMPEP